MTNDVVRTAIHKKGDPGPVPPPYPPEDLKLNYYRSLMFLWAVARRLSKAFDS